MLTKFGKLLAPKGMPYPSLSGSSTEYGSGSGIKANIKFKNYEGTLYAVTPFISTFYRRYDSTTLSNSFAGVKFGSGDSSESEDSYTLDNIITSSLTVSIAPGQDTIYHEYDSENNAINEYVLYTITNNDSESVTINEIGLFARAYTGSDIGQSVSSSAQKTFLIDRTVLDAPLTLAPNDSAVLKYSFALPGIAA